MNKYFLTLLAPEIPSSRAGEIYHLGDHLLMCGDATNPDDVEALMGETEADLWLSDPPYNVAYEGSNGLTIENDNMSDSNCRGACHDIGLKVRQCFVWKKNSLVLGRQDYQWIHEPCLY